MEGKARAPSICKGQWGFPSSMEEPRGTLIAIMIIYCFAIVLLGVYSFQLIMLSIGFIIYDV